MKKISKLGPLSLVRESKTLSLVQGTKKKTLFLKEGYIESSKTFQIDIPGQKQIKTSKNIVFKEEIILQRIQRISRWKLTVRLYLLPLQQFRGRKTLFQLIQLLQLICSKILQ
jgi:hypothetical protein